MQKTKKEAGYNEYVKSKEPKTKYWPTLIWAFLIGGAICCLGQGVADISKLIWPTLSETDASAIAAGVLVFLAAFLTGIGWFDKIGEFAGAGTMVPITGFSNSISAAAMEYKNEGFIFGMCAKMFTIAGPVIVNGLAVGFIVGLIYLIFGL